ncbi:MAG: hypothetical protein IKY33_00165 [Clostridia bacterium]|nr:hypothetical protein [Clostridia bacterium]
MKLLKHIVFILLTAASVALYLFFDFKIVFFTISALLVNTACTKLQYHITYKNACMYSFKKYPIGFMALPPYILCFGNIAALQKSNIPEYSNPLYHENLFKWCYTWGSLLMLITLFLWVGMLAMNLFGSLKYGYYGINILSAVGLGACLYVATDIFAMGTRYSTIFMVLTILYEILFVLLWFYLRKKNIQPVNRAFFALADQDELLWRKKLKDKRWRD